MTSFTHSSSSSLRKPANTPFQTLTSPNSSQTIPKEKSHKPKHNAALQNPRRRRRQRQIPQTASRKCGKPPSLTSPPSPTPKNEEGMKGGANASNETQQSTVKAPPTRRGIRRVKRRGKHRYVRSSCSSCIHYLEEISSLGSNIYPFVYPFIRFLVCL